MVSKEVILAYPDWTQPFIMHTDASDFQLGTVISQNDKPIAFFSRKLNSAQRNYTTTEKELLSIVECLKEFRNIGLPFGLRKIFFLHQIQFVESTEHNSGLNRSYYCEYGVSLWLGESGVWQKLQVV